MLRPDSQRSPHIQHENPSYIALSCTFGASLHGRYPASPLLWPLLTASPFSWRSSAQVRCRIYPLVPSGSTECVSDDFWASLFPASSPPAPGLPPVRVPTVESFATRFFQLHLAATPCVSLRLPSSAPVGLPSSNKILPIAGHTGAGNLARSRLSGGSYRPWASFRARQAPAESRPQRGPRARIGCPTICAAFPAVGKLCGIGLSAGACRARNLAHGL